MPLTCDQRRLAAAQVKRHNPEHGARVVVLVVVVVVVVVPQQGGAGATGIGPMIGVGTPLISVTMPRPRSPQRVLVHSAPGKRLGSSSGRP